MKIGMEFEEWGATKQKSVKKSAFSLIEAKVQLVKIYTGKAIHWSETGQVRFQRVR